MRYASVCSGVGTDHLAFAPLGWECAWFSEIDPFACAVLAHRFPAVPNLGDMMALTDEELERHGPIDLLVGGTPCQGFSSAGRGAGLGDPRSRLALEFVRLARRLAPRWVVWENVGGVRNAKHAGDLSAFIEAFREVGYLGAFRSLDAQYFGLAQRRDRVFAVFHPGDWRPPAAVLLEPDCVRRDPAAVRDARKDVAGTLRSRTGGGCGPEGPDGAAAGHLVPLARCDTTGEGNRQDFETTTLVVGVDLQNIALRTDGLAGTLCAKGQASGNRAEAVLDAFVIGDPRRHDDRHRGWERPQAVHPTLGRSGPQTIAFHATQDPISGDVCPLMSGKAQYGVLSGEAVRRLTPRETERLQGLPDDWTLVPYPKKPAKDGPRYRAIGNGIAMPVLAWIGRRIDLVDGLLETRRPA